MVMLVMIAIIITSVFIIISNIIIISIIIIATGVIVAVVIIALTVVLALVVVGRAAAAVAVKRQDGGWVDRKTRGSDSMYLVIYIYNQPQVAVW